MSFFVSLRPKEKYYYRSSIFDYIWGVDRLFHYTLKILIILWQFHAKTQNVSWSYLPQQPTIAPTLSPTFMSSWFLIIYWVQSVLATWTWANNPRENWFTHPIIHKLPIAHQFGGGTSRTLPTSTLEFIHLILCRQPWLLWVPKCYDHPRSKDHVSEHATSSSGLFFQLPLTLFPAP